MNDIFESIYCEATRLLIPLTQAAADGDLQTLLSGLGLNVTAAEGLDLSELQTALTAVTDAVSKLSQMQGPEDLTAALSALDDVKSVFMSVQSLPGAVSGANIPAALTAAWAQIESRLFGHLIAQWLLDEHQAVYQTLRAFGAIAFTAPNLDPVVNTGGAASWLPIPVRSVDSKTLLALVRDPEHVMVIQLLGDPPATGAAAVTRIASTLWPRLQTVTQMASIPLLLGSDPALRAVLGDLGQAGNALADATVFIPAAEGTGPLITLTLAPPLSSAGRSSAVLSVGDSFALDTDAGPFHVTLNAAGTVRALAVDSAGTVNLATSSSSGDNLTLTLTIAGRSQGSSQPGGLWRIGPATGTHVSLNEASLRADAQLSAAARAAVGGELDVGMSAVLDFTDGDSFVSDAARLLLSGPVSVDAHAVIGWAWGRSVYLRGGATVTTGGATAAPALNTKIPVNLSLGPVTVDTLTVALAPQQIDGGHEQLAVQAGVDVTLDFGPLTAQVSNIGLQALITSADGTGNLGPLDAQLRFKPPDGAGLAIDSAPVSGGGYLAIDAAHGRYLGAVALQVGPVSVQGVAVLSTKAPGVGWSLVALADVSGLSVQLGFGIELTGVGLLVAVHRTMNVAGLQALTRAGQLETVLFPADLAENAPRVAADLDSLFPPAPGEFVLGPIVQLAWGTSSLVTAELAIFIEFPNQVRVAVLGVVQILLPEADDPVADLQLDVLGVLDLSRKTVALDMSLTHSSIAGMPLTGQAAFRGRWGANPAFLLAIGGLNPHFTPPSGFPSLQRIGLVFGKADLMIRLSSYLALSANTLQFGAAMDLRADAGPAALIATASFDALLQFKPFHLDLDVALRAAITLHGNAVMALDVAAHLSGPGPWQLAGKVRFAVLGFSFTIPISGTFGGAAKQIAPAVVDVLPQLVQAVSAASNWTLNAPSGPAVLTLRGGVAGTVLHPLGSLTLTQRVAPLEIPIDRFGADILPAATTLSVTVINPTGGTPIRSQPGIDTDLFAPGQYMTMTDAQRISAPSFEPLTSGLTVSSASVVVAGGNGIAARETDAAQFTPSSKQWDSVVIDDLPAGPIVPTAAAATAGTAATVAVPAVLISAQLASSAAAVASAAPYRAPPSSSRQYGLRLPTYTFVWPAKQSLHTTHAEAAAAAGAAAAGMPIQYLSELPGQAGA